MHLVLIETKTEGEGFRHLAYDRKGLCIQTVKLNMCMLGDDLEEFRKDPKGFVAYLEANQ